MFATATQYDFVDGMESPFSHELIDGVARDHERAVEAIAGLILGQQVNGEVSAEALRWLGKMSDPSSHEARRWLLESCLWSLSPRIRDGATLGLAFLDDPAALPNLLTAVEREHVPELQEDMKQVVDQLEDTKQCHGS